MTSPITSAIQQICEEKGISQESVIETIESALAAAYRKDFGKKNQNIKVEFNAETSQIRVFDVKTVLEKPEEEEEKQEETEKSKEKKEKAEKPKSEEKKEAPPELAKQKEPPEIKFNPRLHITPEEAQTLKKGAKIGEVIKTELEVPAPFGRMAAQTAKQVIIQKLREAERTTLYEEFKTKEQEVLSGIIQRREGRIVLIDLGRTTAILPSEEQISNERYMTGARLKVYISLVKMTAKGPEIIVSRAHPEIVRKLFSLEIPEIANGSVEIKAVAREAGSRSKIAVASTKEGIDPIGSCIGQRGTRVQAIISELGGEKIDIIEYDEDPAKFVSNALSPAKILSIKTNQEEKSALAIVQEDQLSLAIGKTGQNVRLAAKLTGWRIDIKGEKAEKEKTEEVKEKPKEETKSSGEIIEVKKKTAPEDSPVKEKPSKTKK